MSVLAMPKVPASGPCVLCSKTLTRASYCYGCRAFVCWTHRMTSPPADAVSRAQGCNPHTHEVDR